MSQVLSNDNLNMLWWITSHRIDYLCIVLQLQTLMNWQECANLPSINHHFQPLTYSVFIFSITLTFNYIWLFKTIDDHIKKKFSLSQFRKFSCLFFFKLILMLLTCFKSTFVTHIIKLCLTQKFSNKVKAKFKKS